MKYEWTKTINNIDRIKRFIFKFMGSRKSSKHCTCVVWVMENLLKAIENGACICMKSCNLY